CCGRRTVCGLGRWGGCTRWVGDDSVGEGRPGRGTGRVGEPSVRTQRGPGRARVRHFPPRLELPFPARGCPRSLRPVEGTSMTQLPDFATNHSASEPPIRVADRVNDLFRLLRENKVTPPPVAIATAYINPG